jgi:nitrogenase molybdenum-iron protein NifN
MEETKYSRNVNQNPCNMCMPMGGILPFKGLEKAMVLLHGSQGCATYMRRHIAEHFNEPVDVGSSSLNEKGTIYGGEKNLKQGLDNLIRVYQPEIIGVLTTCLAETIGEDIERIGADYLKERDLEGYPLVTVPTPSYSHSHSEGYFLAIRNIVDSITVESAKHEKINIIVPNISPADLREIKRILELMKIEYILLPDFSETLDSPFKRPYKKIPDGGTKLADIKIMGGSKATLQLGITVEDEFSPGKLLEDKFGVPLYNLPIPIGIDSTDQLFNILKEITGSKLPEVLEKERGRLLDAMIDSHKYNFMGKAAIFGEPELVYALTKICLENGITPAVVATGSNNKKFRSLVEDLEVSEKTEIKILDESDFTEIRNYSKVQQVNLAIGHSDGKYLTEKEGIPLVRIGFPIHDRVGGQRILSVGYIGTSMLLDRLTNTLLEQKLTNYRENMYQQFYQKHENNQKDPLEC